MAIYVWRDGRLVDRITQAPLLRGDEPLAHPSIMPDLPAYRSPLGDGVVEGRAARKEHLKRHHCRAVEPGEFKPTTTDRAARVEAQLRMLAGRN